MYTALKNANIFMYSSHFFWSSLIMLTFSDQNKQVLKITSGVKVHYNIRWIFFYDRKRYHGSIVYFRAHLNYTSWSISITSCNKCQSYIAVDQLRGVWMSTHWSVTLDDAIAASEILRMWYNFIERLIQLRPSLKYVKKKKDRIGLL